jgi:hypothetical protein
MVTYGYSQDNGKTWIEKIDKRSPFKIGRKRSKNRWEITGSLIPPTGTSQPPVVITPVVTPILPPQPPVTPPSLGRVAVVNASNETDADVQKWADACKKQADMNISQYWGYTVDVDFIPKGQVIPDVDFYCGILNNSDEAGVLGWHDYVNNKPVIKIFTAECRKYNIQPSTTISHEFAEMIGDEDCNTTVRGFDEQGRACLYFRENADPVEDDSVGYDIDGVRVSDFITPQWFVKDGSQPLDYMNKCSKPYQILQGGYMLLSYDNGASWKEVDKFSKAGTMHKRGGGRWDVYKKIFKGEQLKACEITPGKDVAGGQLLDQLKK